MAMPPTSPNQGEPGADPSMDDILASIRRILSDEEKAAAEPKPPAEDVLVLDQSMMVSEPEPAPEPERAPASPPPLSPSPPPSPQETPVMSEPPALQPQAAPQPATPPVTVVGPAPGPDDALVAPEAAAAAASSVSALMRTLASERNAAVYRGGPTIEDLVREEIRPLLKQWLDANLPPLVERLVRAEIERVVGRMTG